MAQGKPLLKQDQALRPASGPATEKSAPAARSFFKDDFPLVRKAVIALGASLLFSAAIVGISQSTLLKLQSGMNQAQAQRNDARNKRLQTESEKREILEYQPKYMQLRVRGFIGEEKRLDWMEDIQHIRENRKLFPVTYEFSPQQPYQIDPSVQTGDLELRGSKMKFHMDLLHELDLLNFLDDLKSKGFYTVQACTIKRLAALESPQSPRLAADCTLNWLTLGERTAGRGEAPNPADQ